MTAMQELIDRLRLMMDDLPSNSSRALGLATAADLATDLKELEKELLDAAREDEVMKFEKWRIDNGYNIRNNGKYAVYYMGRGNHTFKELYQIYKNEKK